MKVFILVLAICAWLPCFADTVLTKGGESIDGVVMKSGPDTVVVATAEGKKEFDVGDVDNISYSSEGDNLLLLADIARKENDYVKAYLLYEKAIKLNPACEKAFQGLSEIQPFLNKENTNPAWTAQYERYQTSPGEAKAEPAMFEENADQTEELKNRLGVIFARDTGNIKVADVIKGSKADRAGLQIDDVLLAIGDRSAGYMGVLDAVTILLTADGPHTLTVEREVVFWVDQPENTDTFSLPDMTGISLASGGGDLCVSDIKESCSAYRAGIRKGDAVFSINDVPMKGVSPDKAARLILEQAPANMDVFIQKKLSI
ncbi:MAG: PDZ domain-containing protein [Candidatus Omnitrophota bacterium]